MVLFTTQLSSRGFCSLVVTYSDLVMFELVYSALNYEVALVGRWLLCVRIGELSHSPSYSCYLQFVSICISSRSSKQRYKCRWKLFGPFVVRSAVVSWRSCP